MSFNKLLISVLALAAAAIPASATTTFYSGNSSETAFNNAAAAMGLTFGTGLENITATNGTYALGLLDADSTSGLDFFGYNGATQDGVTVTGGVLGQTTSGVNTSLQAQLPTGLVYAYAGTISATSASSPCIEPIISVGSFGNGNCDATVVISGPSDTEFFGVISSTPLSSVFIGATGGFPGSLQIDTIELGEQPAQTPEAATLLMIGSGLIIMRLLKRRANYKSAAAASSRNQVTAPLRVANCAG